MNNAHEAPPIQGGPPPFPRSGVPGRVGRVILAILLTLAPVVLLLWNVESRTRGRDFREFSGDWTRAWDDVAVAAGSLAFESFPVAPYLVTNGFSRKGQVAFDEFKETFSSLERTHHARLSHPLEGFAAQDLFPRRPRVAQRFDDWGRAYCLGWAFRAAGRVAPGMIFWLAPALASLVILWLVIEARRARLLVFGLGVSLLAAASAFCGDTLALGYSAAGFYLISILTCLAYGLGVLGKTPMIRGLWLRALVTGALLAIAISARSVSVTVLPSLLIITGVGAMRLGPSRWRRAGVAMGALVLLIGPTLLLGAHIEASVARAADRFGGDAAPAGHDIWITYWQGLGDFDRTHGHVFLDQAGLSALREHGGNERVSERSEAIMRGLVLESIRSEPGWFAGILFRRAVATLSFQKLWPMAQGDAPGFSPSTAPNEGVTDSYWAMIDQADVFRLGSSRIEAPAILFPLAMAVFFLVSGRRHRADPGDPRAKMVSVVAVLALSALPGPVATTTAGAFEPQSFVLVAFAAMAGLAQIVFWLIPTGAPKGGSGTV